MYTSQQATNFNQRVFLNNNCYCNCFCLICCIEKIPSTFFKKSAALVIHRVKVLCTTNSLALRAFNTVDRCYFPVGGGLPLGAGGRPGCPPYAAGGGG